MTTTADIKSLVIACGADLCGIAPVGRFKGAPAGFGPTDIYPGYKTVDQKLCRPISQFKNTKGYTLKKCNICRKSCPRNQGIGVEGGEGGRVRRTGNRGAGKPGGRGTGTGNRRTGLLTLKDA